MMTWHLLKMDTAPCVSRHKRATNRQQKCTPSISLFLVDGAPESGGYKPKSDWTSWKSHILFAARPRTQLPTDTKLLERTIRLIRTKGDYGDDCRFSAHWKDTVFTTNRFFSSKTKWASPDFSCSFALGFQRSLCDFHPPVSQKLQQPTNASGLILRQI